MTSSSLNGKGLQRSVLCLSLILVGCGGDKPPTKAAVSPVVAAAPTVVPVPTPPPACTAEPGWITEPRTPADVKPEQSFCDFYQFSWQWFLAQVSPAPNGERVFESNRLHVSEIDLGQCSRSPISGRAKAAANLTLRGPKPKDFELEQADGNPLYDRNGNILYYNIWYSAAECAATPTTGFAAGTLEIKTAWRVLEPQAIESGTYFTMSATLPDGGGAATVGLVGFHLVNWTPTHPEMIWATFEHKTNAPLCDGSSSAPPHGWSLTSAKAAECLSRNPQPGPGTISPNCSRFAYNEPTNAGGGTPAAKGNADEICRLYANGNQNGTAVNGNDNASNQLAIQQLNAALVGPGGLLTQLPATDPMAIWKNYEMVGGIWTKGGAASGNAPVPNTYYAGDVTSPQRGSLELTNMTMETFQQGVSSQIPNCFGCHNFDPTTPLTVSHIAQSLFSTTDVCTPFAYADNAQAQAQCPAVCTAAKANLGFAVVFAGNWSNAPANVAAAGCTVGQQSVCGCGLP